MPVEEHLLSERFIRSSGPGGQNVNKVATAVELRYDVARSSLPDDVKARLRALAGWRMSDDGILLIDSRAFRTQTQNREAARERLEAMIARAMVAPRKRKASKPPARSREERMQSKARRSSLKRSRRSQSED